MLTNDDKQKEELQVLVTERIGRCNKTRTSLGGDSELIHLSSVLRGDREPIDEIVLENGLRDSLKSIRDESVLWGDRKSICRSLVWGIAVNSFV